MCQPGSFRWHQLQYPREMLSTSLTTVPLTPPYTMPLKQTSPNLRRTEYKVEHGSSASSYDHHSPGLELRHLQSLKADP